MAQFLRSCVLVMVAVALGVGALPVSAQETSPTAGQDRIVPRPEDCTVTPRTAEALLALATPAATPVTTPVATPTAISAATIPFGAFAGTLTDPETAAEYTGFVHMVWACFNTGDFSLMLATYSDDLLRRGASTDDLLVLADQAGEEPLPTLEANYSAVIAILGIQNLDDGRVGSYVIVDTPFDPLPVEVRYMVAAQTDEGWELDEFVCFDAVGQLC